MTMSTISIPSILPSILPNRTLPLDLNTANFISPITLATNSVIFVAVDTTTVTEYDYGLYGAAYPRSTFATVRTLIAAVDTTTITKYGPAGNVYSTISGTIVTSPLFTVEASETST